MPYCTPISTTDHTRIIPRCCYTVECEYDAAIPYVYSTKLHLEAPHHCPTTGSRSKTCTVQNYMLEARITVLPQGPGARRVQYKITGLKHRITVLPQGPGARRVQYKITCLKHRITVLPQGPGARSCWNQGYNASIVCSSVVMQRVPTKEEGHSLLLLFREC